MSRTKQDTDITQPVRADLSTQPGLQSPLARAANEVHLEAWAVWSNVAGLAESCDRLHDAAMAGDLFAIRNLLRGILADLEEITEDVAPLTRLALTKYDAALAQAQWRQRVSASQESR